MMNKNKRDIQIKMNISFIFIIFVRNSYNQLYRHYLM